jgi:hypothetical protein
MLGGQARANLVHERARVVSGRAPDKRGELGCVEGEQPRDLSFTRSPQCKEGAPICSSVPVSTARTLVSALGASASKRRK